MLALDSWVTISSLATAGGTLVLAVATFASVRSANNAARVAERSYRFALRPILAPSRLEDHEERIMFGDRHWVVLRGGQGAVEIIDGVVYLAMQVRNVGNGIGVIEAWQPFPSLPLAVGVHPGPGDTEPEDLRPQTRSLWVPPGGVAFWQGALRNESEEIHRRILGAVDPGWGRRAVVGVAHPPSSLRLRRSRCGHRSPVVMTVRGASLGM